MSIVDLGKDDRRATIDTFLMSCRIIGRNIEFVFMDFIISDLKYLNIKTITSKFIKTRKNEQVSEFYEKCSFSPLNSDGLVKEYLLDINRYIPHNINYIKVVSSGRQN
jgi:predicted enzyme involved in methoxymalonyl-ACP biosynthesis